MILAIECSSRFLECFADYIYILNFLSHWHIYDKKLQSCVEMETKITRYCIDFSSCCIPSGIYCISTLNLGYVFLMKECH